MNKIKEFLTKIFDTAKKDFVLANAKFVSLVGQQKATAFKQEALSILKTDLGKIALSVVAGIKAVSANLPSGEKRAQALAQILSITKSQGMTASESIINLFIELAVTALQNKI